MPCYNYAAYIIEAIESVRAQTIGDWELLVVDDGSTDGSSTLAERVGDPRVLVVRQTNAGVSVARNAGLAIARGAFVAFLDADDLMRPDRLSVALEIFDRAPTLDAVVANFSRFDHASGQALGDQFSLIPEWRSLPLEPLPPSHPGGPAAFRIVDSAARALASLPLALAWTQGCLIRRSCIGSAQFPPGIRISEDSWFLYRVFQRATVGIVDHDVVRLRRHGNNSFNDPLESLRPELRMFTALSEETTSMEHRRAFDAAAARVRISLGYQCRRRGEFSEALSWYRAAFATSTTRWAATKGLVATALRR